MTLQAIGRKIEESGIKCRWCGGKIPAANIHSYNHKGGIEIEGFNEKQWVYFHCVKCNYDWALWKLENLIKLQKEKS